MTGMKNVADLSETELFRLEREIAHRHIGKFPYLAVIWSFANFAIWLSLWPLVLLGYMPLWIGFIIATINLSLSYLPSHEAQHDIIAKPGGKLRWLNELVGWIGSIPLTIPYPVLKATHMQHHKHTNDPELDPDHFCHASGPAQSIWRYIQARQPRGERSNSESYAHTLVRIGRPDLILLSIAFNVGYYVFLIAMAWSGFALEAALLWWIPHLIAMSYIIFFLAWSPHHEQGRGRYKDTRSWKSVLGNLGTMGMQFHTIHHLHPRIPLYRTPKAYWEMRPILEARGVDLGEL